MPSANQTQVGGDHYQSGYQHWDFVHDHDLGYFEGQITKYITRRRHKNGKQDVEKALHFTMKLKELAEKNHRRPQRGNFNSTLFRAFYKENALTVQEMEVVRGVLNWVNSSDLGNVISAINVILAQYE